EKYGHENFTNVTENMAFILLALLDGDGDFSRSICTANNCGKDTDCTAATVGALLGILNPDGIDEKWLKPIGRDLILSPEIVGVSPPPSLDEFTDLVIDLKERLDGRMPPTAVPVSMPEEKGVPVRIGFNEMPWFGQGWPVDRRLALALPEMKPSVLPGTVATFHSRDFEAGTMFVEYTLHLERETNARVFFNTHENCRIFLDGDYVFGRECGRVSPSPHRMPINQFVDVELTAGGHLLTAVIAKPDRGKTIEWVAGVADRDDNNQWIPDGFSVPSERGK
ncbi:MAG: ADP-ribosylglycohydrolase family protein, partial [Verrucomicrobiota bacterium]|nr:ADP-ribosylglycohydrolase family protein [Verrucomicrobiota bacterium]